MPTISNSNLPTPKSWDEFEEITLDALKLRWDNPELVRHGRTGQAQQGVDVYGKDYFFQFAGVQCKKYDLELTLATIKEEIEKAERFVPELKIFHIATTQPTDAKLQKAVRIISKERVELGKFPVGIYFWNDIVQEIVSNESLLKKHFPQFQVTLSKHGLTKKLYSILDLVFYGSNINHYANLFFGEIGQLAQEDPQQMAIITSVVDSACLSVLDEESKSKLTSATRDYVNYVMPYVTGKNRKNFKWKFANDMGTQIERLVKIIDGYLEGEELMIFRIGELLANWERFEMHKTDSEMSYPKLDILQKLTTKIAGDVFPQSLATLLSDYTKVSDMKRLNYPFKFYSLLRGYLIDSELLGK